MTTYESEMVIPPGVSLREHMDNLTGTIASQENQIKNLAANCTSLEVQIGNVKGLVQDAFDQGEDTVNAKELAELLGVSYPRNYQAVVTCEFTLYWSETDKELMDIENEAWGIQYSLSGGDHDDEEFTIISVDINEDS